MALASSPFGEKTPSRSFIDLYPQAAGLAARRNGDAAELEPLAEPPAALDRLPRDLDLDLIVQHARNQLDGGGRLLHGGDLLRDRAGRRRDVVTALYRTRRPDEHDRRHAVDRLNLLTRFLRIVEADGQEKPLLADLQRVLRQRRGGGERKRHYKPDQGAAIHVSFSTRQAVLGL